MLQFILGRAASGKTTEVHKRIAEEIKTDNNLILLVPEQNTFETERRMLEIFGGGFMSKVDVLSFTRMCERAGQLYGGIAGLRVSDAERKILMGRALKNTAPHLNLFKKYVSSPSFVTQMTEVIKEFKMAAVGSDKLISIIEDIENPHLANKLAEIAMIFSTYNELLKGIYIDPLDDLEVFYQKAIDNQFFKGKTVYIDAFKGFTGIQQKILKLMINSADKVVITLCCDCVSENSGTGVFSNIINIVANLTAYAVEHHVKVESPVILEKSHFKSDELFFLERLLATGIEKEYENISPNITIATLDNPIKEIECVFKTIHRLVREEGYRFKDFVIIARDISQYERRIFLASEKFEVPCYFDKRHNLMTSPIARFIVSMLKSSVSFNTENILSLIKTGFLGFSDEDITMLEEYVFVWDINGKAWLEEWKMNPEGFVSSQNKFDYEQNILVNINSLREVVVRNLLTIKNSFGGTAEDISRALYNSLISLKVDEAVKEYCKQQFDSNEVENADFVMQSWDAVMELLDSIVRCYGETPVNAEEYIDMLELSFTGCSIGSIPRMLDEVSCGSADRIRPARPKIVFAIGLNLSEFPKIAEDSGILLRSDRIVLSDKGIEISDRFKKTAIDENYLVYAALCCASEKVYAFCHASGYNGTKTEESPTFSLLKKVFNKSLGIENSDLPETLEDGFDLYAKNKNNPSTLSASLESIYLSHNDYIDRAKALDNLNTRIVRRVSPEICHSLFGDNLKLSPSKIEVYNKCPFSYFCKYVLKINRLQKAELDNLQRGTVVHYVLEKIINKLGDKIADTPYEELEHLVDEKMQEYLETISGFEYLESPFFKFAYSEIGRNTKFLIKHMAEQFKNSDFVPSACEFNIDDNGGNIPSMSIEFKKGHNVILNGTIDRVDVFKNEAGQELVRVVDYKTNGKIFYLSDVFYGQNLQMLIYLHMLRSVKKSKYKDMEPAGVLYMPSKRGTESDNSKNPLMMNGMILNETEVINAMDKEGKGRFVFKVSEKQRYTDPAISLEDFDTVFDYLEKIIKDAAKNIFEGNFDLTPRDGRDCVHGNACEYCDFKAVCCVEDDFEHQQTPAEYPDEILKRMKEVIANGMD